MGNFLYRHGIRLLHRLCQLPFWDRFLSYTPSSFYPVECTSDGGFLVSTFCWEYRHELTLRYMIILMRLRAYSGRIAYSKASMHALHRLSHVHLLRFELIGEPKPTEIQIHLEPYRMTMHEFYSYHRRQRMQKADAIARFLFS